MASAATLHAEGPEYTAAEAGSHVGDTATVTDKVGRVNQASGGNIFVNMGAGRDAGFTVFISAKVADKFPEAKSYEGKTISVSGQITAHKEKPEIAVTEPSQITVKDEAGGDSAKSSPSPGK